jgi:glucoamylase
MNEHPAPGAPGIQPRWTSSAKDGIGTAYSTTSRVWFTISHGILNEIYFPHVDSPNMRDMQLLITDGESFFHEEKRDLQHVCERPEAEALLYRLTNIDPTDRYRIVKEIIGQPHSAVVLQSIRIEILDPALRNKLRIFALLAPHVNDSGWNNSARTLDCSGQRLLHADRNSVHLVLGSSSNFLRRSVGYVGTSDGWQDLKDNFQMDWEYTCAENGNVALMGEIDLSRAEQFTLGISFGHSCQAATTALLQSFVQPFRVQRKKFVEQ